MRVQLVPFGLLKETLTTTTLDVPQHATVKDLVGLLPSSMGLTGAATKLLNSAAISVNAEYAAAGQVLQEGDLIGLLPPVSGGSANAWLTRDPIPSGELISAAKRGSDGAVVVFEGVVRDNSRGRKTLYLEYEAYEEMAERQMHVLVAQALKRFAIREAVIVHRIGRLHVGETSVLIVVCSAHRAAAFDANRWLIDTLKKTVPIWKKEIFVDGSAWADGEPFPPELAPAALLTEQRS